jgi:hypothetical protein
VTFTLRRRAGLGDSYKVVGPAPELGRWLPEVARRMEWTEGDVWTASVRLPPGEHAFKAALRAADGAVTWEAGPDRSVAVPPGGGAVAVALDVRMPWEVADGEPAAPAPAPPAPAPAAAAAAAHAAPAPAPPAAAPAPAPAGARLVVPDAPAPTAAAPAAAAAAPAAAAPEPAAAGTAAPGAGKAPTTLTSGGGKITLESYA